MEGELPNLWSDEPNDKLMAWVVLSAYEAGQQAAGVDVRNPVAEFMGQVGEAFQAFARDHLREVRQRDQAEWLASLVEVGSLLGVQIDFDFDGSEESP